MTSKYFLELQKSSIEGLGFLLESPFSDLLAVSELIPCCIHINSIEDFSFKFMSNSGQKIIRYTNEELNTLGHDLLKKHQSKYTLNVTHVKLIKELKDKGEDHVSFYLQDWKCNPGDLGFLFYTMTKILNQQELISISFFPQQFHFLNESMDDLFNLHNTFEIYSRQFLELTPREKEITQLLGMGLSRKAISIRLFISEKTVKKHCENIYKKLGTNQRFELRKIAFVFYLG